MTRLLLVRHALHDWVGRGIAGRMPQVALNGEGELQARDLARRLAPVKIDALYSSPQPRARATAEPLAQARNLRIEVLHEFDEIDFGDWEGLSFDVLDRDHHDAWQHWIHRRSAAQLPRGETFAQVRERAMRGVARIREACPDGTAMVVSHGDVIKAVVATQLNMSFDDLERFEIGVTSVTVIDIGEGWSQLRQLNGTGA